MSRHPRSSGHQGDSYRAWHIDAGSVRAYEDLYSLGTFDSWMWEREKRALDSVLERHVESPAECRYLDFACGTGRLASHLEGRVAEAWAVDISREMLEIAARRLQRTSLVCCDVTASNACVPGRFDLITAFRFLLNAESDLRESVLQALRRRLMPNGLLIGNIHGNAWSLRAPSVLIRRHGLRQRSVNQLSPAAIRRLLRRAGFEIVDWAGIGSLPTKGFNLAGERVSDWLSDRMEGHSLAKYFCPTGIFAARCSRSS